MLVERNILVGTYETYGTFVLVISIHQVCSLLDAGGEKYLVGTFETFVLVVTLATLVVLTMAPSSNTTEVITPHA